MSDKHMAPNYIIELEQRMLEAIGDVFCGIKPKEEPSKLVRDYSEKLNIIAVNNLTENRERGLEKTTRRF